MYLISYYQQQKKESSAIQQQQGLEPLQNEVKELKNMIEKILIIVEEQRETINSLTKQQDEQTKLLEIIKDQQGNKGSLLQQSNELNNTENQFLEINESILRLQKMEEIKQKNRKDIPQQQQQDLPWKYNKFFYNIQQSSIIEPQPQLRPIFEINHYIQSDVVIITSGTKYHKKNCIKLKFVRQEVRRTYAIEQGYEACSICNP